MTKAESGIIGLLLTIGLIAWGIAKVLDATGIVLPAILVVAAIVAFALFKQAQRKKRIEYLRSKYADENIVQSIMERRYWRGQTSDQLIESIGSPHSIDNKMLKTMKREVWKYNHRGANRYGLRITLDNDVVTTWDHKN